jgi:succinate dehydrogenase / fumarate reductase membrane anchor subunit
MAVYTMRGLHRRDPGAAAHLRRLEGDLLAALFQIATMMFVAALLYHAWVGMRDILMDYVKPRRPPHAQVAVGLMLFFYLVWTASILWGLPK